MNNLAALSFNNTNLDIVDRNGQQWMQSPQIALALGYKQANAVTKIFNRNSDEFTPNMVSSIDLPNLGKQRIFSLRGAHLIAFFARTEKAKEFRKWVLDIIETKQPAIPSTVSPEQQRIIQEAVAELAHDNKAYAKYYGIIKTHFKIAKYDQLPADKLEEALEILQGVVVQPKAIAEPAKINKFNEPAKIAEPSWSGELLEYAGKSIRILMRDNEPWFLAADVCQFFGFNQAKHLGTFASPEDKAYHSAADPNGRTQAYLLLPLSIVLISASQCRGAARQSAKLFIHWLCAVAMPSLLAKTTLLAPVVAPAPQAAIPDDMIMVNRTNFMALKNRVVLIYKRQRELDAIKASIDPIIAQLDALKNDVGDYVHNTTDPVREANLMATTLGGSDLPDVKALV